MRVQVKKSGYKLDLANKFGIFASSLLVTSAAVWLYSPVIGSHADSSITTEVKASIEPVASITLDTNNLTFNVVPTSAGAFSSQSITATVTTNSTGGYELYFSSVDDGTAMTHSSDSVTATVSSNFEGTVTSSTMSANTWGYSLDDTDFLKIPTLTNSTKIKDIDHFPETAEKSTPVYIGTKISSSLPSGSYSKDVVFTVVAHETPEPELTMQTFEENMLANVGDSIELKDVRDGNIYTVKKLADNRVWMTESLEITNKTISSSDSDLPDGTEYTIPNNSNVTVDTQRNFTSYASGVANAGTTNAAGSICPKGWRLPTTRPNGSDNGDFHELYGEYDTVGAFINAANIRLTGYTYKNWYDEDVYVDSGVRYFGKRGSSDTAIQVKGTEVSIANIKTGEQAQVRCVKKETYSVNLDPNGGSVSVSSITAEKGKDLNLPIPTSSNPNLKFVGWYTARTGGDMITRFDTKLTSSGDTLYAHWESPSATPMQSFTCSTLSNIGDSIVLKDSRDNNSYLVKKLADGKCWMVENLKIVNKTISSDDSNLPNGTTFTIPASDVTAFTNTYDTSAAYLGDGEAGGFYNFYTITAGWGTQSVSSGSSPRDICPKGWKLPGRSMSDPNKNELSNDLLGSYASQTQFRRDFVPMGSNNFGMIMSGALVNDGYSRYSTSVPANASSCSIMGVDDYTGISGTIYYKYHGYSARCYAKN